MPLTQQVNRGLREGALIVLIAIAVYLFISLVSYFPEDPGWSHQGSTKEVMNIGGPTGAWFADVFFTLFGIFAYLFPMLVAIAGWVLYKGREDTTGHNLRQLGLRVSGAILTLLSGTGLAALHLASPRNLLEQGIAYHSGGILGEFISQTLIAPFSLFGATLFLSALALTGISLFAHISWLVVLDQTGALTLGLIAGFRETVRRILEYVAIKRAQMKRSEASIKEKAANKERKPPRIDPVIKKIDPSIRAQKERQVPLFKPTESTSDAGLPPLSLLDPAAPPHGGMSRASLEAMSRQVELKLKDFGVSAEVTAVNPGPIVTRYELELAPGVKVSQISNLSKDLARSLSAVSVRVVEVIPGKSVIGIEIPNEQREIVRLSEILQSREYDNCTSSLPLALGKDISGQPVVVDVTKMPHLLVAGTTGSGKSVAINAMVLSLLYKASPEDVRLIMIDPKMLELSVYEGIPHLLTPVVTDMKDAAHALRWCVAEMDRRYALMAALGVRNLSGYNKKVKDAIQKGVPIPHPANKDKAIEGEEIDPETLEPFPYIVVVIDEFADMIMVVGKKVEELIARIAQKARASGIHLLLATQRPSVNVITGLIKANIPTRIAFQVSSKIDSRTILDQQGAEQLLGHGDMLYLPAGTGVPTRVHGAFVADNEVHKVVAHLKGMGAPDYLDEILHDANPENEAFSAFVDDDTDVLYDDALRIVTETRRASISAVQRRLKVGYNRAARMIEEMERTGVVGPIQSNGSREVLAPPPPSL